MAKINVTADEFANIVVSFLLDKFLHMEEMIPNNELFNKYMEDLKLKGVKPKSLNYYLKMGAQDRILYKRIKDVFFGSKNKAMTIYVYPNKETKKDFENKETLVKRVVRKLLKKEDINRKEFNLLVEKFKGDE